VSFEESYRESMKVLDKYIKKVEGQLLSHNDDFDKKLWYEAKLRGMKTAKSTIEENIKVYLMLDNAD
jgi:hypothetical protein